MSPRTVALATCMILLAGCSQSTQDDSDDDTPAPADANSYTITLSEFPLTPLEAGQEFRFNSTISGAVERTSDHIGGHFGNNSTTAPSTTVYAFACVHQSGQLPGKYQVTCGAPQQPGVYYLRGHARIIYGNTTVNWWSTEHSFTVAPLQT